MHVLEFLKLCAYCIHKQDYKNIIEWISQNGKCPHCQAQVNTTVSLNIDIESLQTNIIIENDNEYILFR